VSLTPITDHTAGIDTNHSTMLTLLLELISMLRCLSLCNTQTRAVNLIHAILCFDEGATLDVSLGNTQARAVNLIPGLLCVDEDVTLVRGC